VEAEALPGSRRFARVRLEFGPSKAGDVIDGKILVFVDGQADAVLAVSVSARVSHFVELLPATRYRPRHSSSGSIYSGTVLCRSPGQDALTIRVGTVPPGVTVRVADSANTSPLKSVVIDADPKVARGELVVPFTARSRDREVTLSLRVVIDPPE
jgi:hypothetical protein